MEVVMVRGKGSKFWLSLLVKFEAHCAKSDILKAANSKRKMSSRKRFDGLKNVLSSDNGGEGISMINLRKQHRGSSSSNRICGIISAGYYRAECVFGAKQLP